MPTTPTHCVFCALKEKDLVWESDLVVAFRDGFPVSKGHTLVVPRRHVSTYFEASAHEQSEIWRAVDDIRRRLDQELKPDGYNVGFNAGEAAGQTVMHLHVHVIPRFEGDMDDPRGGVRHVIPGKGNYLASTEASPSPTGTKESAFASLPVFVPGREKHFKHALVQALQLAECADMVVAFVQTSGLAMLKGDMEDALRRGARIRVLTGDYFNITSADALRVLLRLAEDNEGFEASFFRVDTSTASFHAKSYIFTQGSSAVAYVGSSNLSGAALTRSVEWNLRLISEHDNDGLRQIQEGFESLWSHPCTQALTRDIVDEYETRAPVPEAPEARVLGPQPHPIQTLALAALRKTRSDDHRKGLVVLATGLGKTYLSAFDCRAMGGERALFVAHREEILDRAADTWASVFPDRSVGMLAGGKVQTDADIVFASVQTLARKRHLGRFSKDHFDYIVIDEFHHAAAATYRKIIAHFTPRFLLGLTATPDRSDGASLLELCGDNMVFRRDLVHGISTRLLVPFHYYAVKDCVDFEPIPWRSGRFDVEELTSRVATEARAEQALREYKSKGIAGKRRTLAFCCSTKHADYMAEYLSGKGHAAVSVHSGPGSAPRSESLKKLISGEIEIICAVDIFNEGLDVPDINTILMLRPTQSPIIFLQQLGRGLRLADNKPFLTIIDLIGNHRSFLQKPQTLVYLSGHEVPAIEAIRRIQNGTLELPEGCSVEIETEALDMLATLAKRTREDVLIYEYMNFRDTHGRRPNASELWATGVSFKAVKDNHGNWFGFVREQADLEEDEARVLARHEAWFADLLKTSMTKSFKMVALQALIDSDALFDGMSIHDNAERSHQIISESLLFYREAKEQEDRGSFGPAYVSKWKEMPLRIWHQGNSTSQKWFAIEGDAFQSKFVVEDPDRDAFERMTEELVAFRLQEHLDKLRSKQPVDGSHAPAILKVSHSSNKPILRFDRKLRPDIPEGETPVHVDGEEYLFRFVKIAVNVITSLEGGNNLLPTLMRRWFGPSAGHPGTHHQVQLLRTQKGWRLEKQGAIEEASVIPFPTLPFYEDLQVACGAFAESGVSVDDARRIAVQANVAVDPSTHFVIRASGDSMDGGDRPIRDGDLVLCEWRSGGSAQEVSGKPWLIVGYDANDTTLAALKVPIKQKGGWLLRSWNPEYKDQELPELTKIEPIAKAIGTVEEATGLVMWGEYTRDEIAPAFGSTNNPSWRVGHRDIDVEGKPHTILMVTLRKPDSTKLEHRYADRFLSPTEFQWESQASTKEVSAKGNRITGHEAEGRKVHLFVRRTSRQAMTYCGTLRYARHEGECPMRVWFELEQAPPNGLWRLWEA